MMVMPTPLRPPELQIEGAIIEIVNMGRASNRHRCRGRVIEVSGPREPDPHYRAWFGRDDLGGYTITFEQLDEHLLDRPPAQRIGWINEVFVERGRIYACPWRDEIKVVEGGAGQARLW